MSADPNTVVPENGLNDCVAQPPKNDAAAAACSERPSLNGVARASSPSNFEVVVSSENDVDVSAAATYVPSPIDDVSAAATDVPSPIDDVSAAATELQVDPVDVVPDLNVAGPTSSSDDVPENEINQEVVDLGTDPHFYEDNKKKVGYDRGLEPDHIVGATEKNGKLMFLIEWKNSIDGEADLVEAKEVYKRSPQIAIQFFEKRICFIHASKKT